MGSVKVPFTYHGSPNLINFETDMDLQKWTALRKQTSNISGNTCPNVIEENGPGFSVDRTYSSKDSIEKTSQELPRQIPSISLNDSDSQVIQSNVSVWGIVEKQQFKVLVDTGAAVTVVSEKFYQEILRARYPLITEGGLDSVRTADGNTVPVRGTVTFSIIMGHNAYVCSASVVVGLSYNIVLGRDFLHDFSAIIDVRGQVVTFVGGNTVTFASENDAPIVSNVKVAKTMVIDAQSESIIPATLTTSLQLPVVGLIEALPKLSDRYHLHGACTLSCPGENGEVSFRLLNPSDTPVVLHKGSVIGKFEQLRSPTDIVPLTPNDRLCAAAASRQQECQAQPLLAPLRMPADAFHLQFNSVPNPSLTTAENAKLAELLTNFSDIFASSSLDLGHTQLVQHEIDTGDARPIKQRPYRVSNSHRVEIDRHISNMLDQNIIQVSASPWSSPVVLVKKKDGTTRFCVDYRKLNAVTRKDSYPLPRIDDALDSLSGSRFFSTLDLQSGYHQVAMHPNSKDKTAFISHSGLYEFNVLSFGLTNAPPNFQRLMNKVLHGLDWKICLIYIDDIIIFSSTFQEHLHRLALVFSRLREANLKLKPSKCKFASHSVDFLGFVVSSDGISPNPDKIEAVRSFPVPTSVKELRSFLGLSNYYRRFVEGFSKIASPLNRLTRKDAVFSWSPECQSAFQTLKDRLCYPPILSYPDFSHPFHLFTDASQTAVGYVLGQFLDGKEHVIAYGGRELSHAETHYSTTEREALAVVDGIKRYQPYLSGKKFYVHTDHGSLSWLMSVKDPTGRLARWALRLQQYDFDIIHRPGVANGNADALSRRRYSSTVSSPPLTSIDFPVAVLGDSCPPPNILYDLQRKDPDLAAIIAYLESSELPESDSKARALLLSIDSFYLDSNGILCHLWSPGKCRVKSLCTQVVIPSSLRYELLVALHDDPTAGHLGPDKTYEKVRLRYYWTGMYKDIEHWCHSCIDCAMKKTPRNKSKAPLLPIPIEGAFDRLAVDILGPFPVSDNGNRYIAVFSDYYTRWPEAFALPSTEAPRIAQLLVDEILSRHGAPRTLLSDRGPNFLSSIVKEVCKLMNTRKANTTAYHPQTDGLVERFNGTLAEGLSMYVSGNQKDWDRHLPLVLFAYRVSPHASTRESPFYLLYGREPRLPIDASLLLPSSSHLSSSVAEHRARIVQNLEHAQHLISANTQLAQQKMKEQYDRTSKPVPFDIGCKVWVYTPKSKKGLSKKLMHNYHGPYRIVARLSPVHFRLRTMDNRPVAVPVHANRMKPYFDPNDRPIDPPSDLNDGFELSESDLPNDSYAEVISSTEPQITRPEDVHPPQEIKDNVT